MGKVSNEDVITAVFTATTEAKSRALEILQNRDRPQATQPPRQEYLTIKEACALLRCCRMTLYRMESDGQIECVHLRGKKLFEREALIKALKH